MDERQTYKDELDRLHREEPGNTEAVKQMEGLIADIDEKKQSVLLTQLETGRKDLGANIKQMTNEDPSGNANYIEGAKKEREKIENSEFKDVVIGTDAVMSGDMRLSATREKLIDKVKRK